MERKKKNLPQTKQESDDEKNKEREKKPSDLKHRMQADNFYLFVGLGGGFEQLIILKVNTLQTQRKGK